MSYRCRVHRCLSRTSNSYETVGGTLGAGTFYVPDADKTHNNPVDDLTYVAPGGWQTNAPTGGVKPVQEKVSLEGVRLLQSQEEIASRTTANQLATFVKLAHKDSIRGLQRDGDPEWTSFEWSG